ncbi:hypothetical protein ES705_34279 [subsurface metagenome]
MFVYSPHNSELFCGNDGGIYMSDDHGETWNDLSDGLEILQSYRIGVSQTESDMVISGNQDNGTFLYRDNIWNGVYGGDGMECIIDYTNPDIIYSSVYYGNIYKSMDGGLSYRPVKPSPDLSGAWITPYIMSRNYHNKLYIGYDQIYKTVDGGSKWVIVSDFTGGNLAVIRIAPSNENYLYASDWNNIWKTSDGGKNWTKINNNLPVVVITDIAISGTDPNKIWISASGYDDNEKVFYSMNGGNSWINFSQGLPNVPANCLLYHEGSNQQLYVGTDIGIFHRNATMNSWEDFSGNLPNVIVNELEFQENDNTLFAGTYGRGIWRVNLPDTFKVSPTAIEVNISEACLNGELMFTLKSDVDEFDSIQWDFGPDAFVSDESNEDTMLVRFGSIGKKDITITTYPGGIHRSEIYYEFINVVESIEFEVFPGELYNCDSDSTEIYITGNYELLFSPSDWVNQTSQNTAFVELHPGTLTITAAHGSCINSYNLDIIDIPDDICAALTIYEGVNGPFSNSCATPQADEPVPPEGTGNYGGCFSQSGWCQSEARIDNSVWFRFEYPDNIPGMSIETEGFDNQIAVYKANSCQDLLDGNYILLAANDDFQSNADYAATITNLAGAEAGDNLWLQVDGSYGGATGTFKITLNHFTISNSQDIMPLPGGDNIKVYPNPTDGNFIIEINGSLNREISIEVLDISGNIISSYFIGNALSPITTEVDMKESAPGMYLVKITSRNNTIVRKVFVH